jgi:hypothetical protein
VVNASIVTGDGTLDLGTQRVAIRDSHDHRVSLNRLVDPE